MKKFLTILLISLIFICIVILSYVIEDDNDQNLIRIKSNDTYFITDKYDTIPNGIIFYDYNQERMVEVHGNYLILRPNN